MLDIVMPAHKPNYERMAHRALSQGAKTDTSVRGALQSAADLVPLAGKIVLSLEGGKHRDFEAAEAYLSSQNLAWQIVHSDEISSYYEALMRGIEHCTSTLLAIIPPWCEITDNLWVQRMTWPLSTDQTALLCTTGREQGPAKDMAPFIAKPRMWPDGEIIVARRAELTEILRLVDPSDFYNNLAKAVALNGWRIWAHPGIRFTRHEHADHNEARATTAR
jgi:hypothetical protein